MNTTTDMPAQPGVSYFPLCDPGRGMVCLVKRCGVGPTARMDIRLIAEFSIPDKAGLSLSLAEGLVALHSCSQFTSGSARTGDWALLCAASAIARREGHLTAHTPLFASPLVPPDPLKTDCAWPQVRRTLVMMDRTGAGVNCVDEAASLLGFTPFNQSVNEEQPAAASGVYQVFVAPLSSDGGFGVYLADKRSGADSQLVAAFAEPLAAGDMAWRLNDLGQRAATSAGRDGGDTVVLETARILAEEAGWLSPGAPLLNHPPQVESLILPPEALAQIEDLDELLFDLAQQAEGSFVASSAPVAPEPTGEAAPLLGLVF